MLNRTLERHIRGELQQQWPSIQRRLELAELARAVGDWREYFARSYVGTIPELFWVLEEYEPAQLYYRLGAQRQMEKRAWYEAHDPAFPINIDLFEEAEMYLRAGLLERAGQFLPRSYGQETAKKQPSWTRLRRLALAAAQARELDLIGVIDESVRLGVAEYDRCAELTRQAGQLLHEIGPAEVAFLLGDYDKCRRHLESVLEAEQLVRQRRMRLRYLDGQTGISLIFAKAKGLYVSLELTNPRRRHLETYEHALQHFEKAIGRSRALGDLSWSGYQVRLYARLAKDLLEGRQPDPNPFAQEPVGSEKPAAGS